MEQAAAEARYDEVHEKLAYHDGTFKSWSEKRSKQYPYHYRDGVTLWVSKDDRTPEENIFNVERARPAVEP